MSAPNVGAADATEAADVADLVAARAAELALDAARSMTEVTRNGVCTGMS